MTENFVTQPDPRINLTHAHLWLLWLQIFHCVQLNAVSLSLT